MSHARPGDLPAVRIDAGNEWAWCGEERLQLTPRSFAVLRHLVEHPRRLITKEDLRNQVWHEAIVSGAALTTCIRDLRKALRDSSRAPRYIETVHRRGFRFIGPIAPTTLIAPADLLAPPAHSELGGPPSGAALSPPAATLVGREVELARLHARRESALSGQRQLVFVTGEPGIGKTALVETFLAEVGEREALRIGRGQ